MGYNSARLITPNETHTRKKLRKDTSSIINSKNSHTTTKITSKSQNGSTVVSAHLLNLTLSCLAKEKKEKEKELSLDNGPCMH